MTKLTFVATTVFPFSLLSTAVHSALPTSTKNSQEILTRAAICSAEKC